ncbi:MAG: hypothetical protein MMC33_004262 [Icmadophila ericetorum]|nr:hypothetical protein [Icmadophila ericetorum]
MGEAKDASSSEIPAPSKQDRADLEKTGAPDHPAASAAAPSTHAPVQGVPVGAGPYYPPYGPGQDRPAGYGSYGAQGPPGTGAYPYHSQVPQSFEVAEVQRPQQHLPCGIGYQLLL